MSSELLVDVSAGIAVLTLNRPAQQNAFTPAMIAELSAALQRCDIEDAIRVVVITGTPPALWPGAALSARGGGGTRTNHPFRFCGQPAMTSKPLYSAAATSAMISP
ncbi:enoyl-CoA hydratase-related protein [Nocardia cyriacigeorgica]|uniref:enoyl-CoA hydratase-related protein n=1 Tax=Nocardia cyriacigeorgica TaxID=135487 RepID=UPI0024573314|nr:enoyl-CoA hydratase-related protein [Nocardia cyriacigeorgica]